MRALIFLAVIVLLMLLIGWVTVSRSSDQTSINIETQRIESDTQRVRQSGEELLEKARQAVDRPQPAASPAPNSP